MFALICNHNGELTSVTAEQRGRAIAVNISGGGTILARSLSEATRKAADLIAPHLDRARRTEAEWGLYVSAGDVSALFGEFPPDPVTPTITGPPAKRSSEVARIHDQWAHRDGSPLGALDAAIKIIQIYAERSTHRRAA